MCKPKTDILYLILTFFAAVCFLLIPSSHTAAQQTGSKTQSVPLPVYQKGTTFVYSDGHLSAGKWVLFAALYSEVEAAGGAKNLIRYGGQGRQGCLGDPTQLIADDQFVHSGYFFELIEISCELQSVCATI